uniref:Uncharacterized protein n=1 Tax=Geobacter metallireducens TaxID=28232 RepID=A0A831XM37_GEOME
MKKAKGKPWPEAPIVEPTSLFSRIFSESYTLAKKRVPTSLIARIPRNVNFTDTDLGRLYIQVVHQRNLSPLKLRLLTRLCNENPCKWPLSAA